MKVTYINVFTALLLLLLISKVQNAVNGIWGSWNSWGSCSRTCGDGYQTRIRYCNNPSPSNGGSYCSANAYQVQHCLTKCKVNGAWGSWNSWGSCSHSCGNGYQKRTRYCNNPSPKNGGAYCSGDGYEIQTCHKEHCQVNGKYGPWSEWGQCDVTCGSGKKRRTRSCTSPAPAYGGSNCLGSSTDLHTCLLNGCPVPGSWNLWASWEACSRTCGGGYSKRRRYCNNPRPLNSGSYCPGDAVNIQSCNSKNCPVHGKYGPWSEWGQCDVTCGSGKKRRSRSCSSPAPAHGGSNCLGISTELRTCSLTGCPVPGIWSLWASWEACSRTCGDGYSKRRRYCNNPRPLNGGSYCPGDAVDIQSCNSKNCPGQYSGGEVGGVAAGCIAGTFLLILVGYGIYRVIYSKKHGKSQKIRTMYSPCSKNKNEMKENRGRRNNHRETIKLKSQQNDCKDTVELPCKKTKSEVTTSDTGYISMADTPHGSTTGGLKFVAKDAKNAKDNDIYENCKI